MPSSTPSLVRIQCKKTARTTGKRCERKAVPGYEVCGYHGAGFPSRGRPGGRPIVTGEHSKFAINKMAAEFEKAKNDPELLSLQEPLALIVVRINQLISRAEDNFDPKLFSSAQKAWEKYKYQQTKGEYYVAKQAMEELDELFDKQGEDYQIWGEINRLLENYRKLSESERKRYIEMGQMITTEDAYKLIGLVLAVIRRRVHDPVTLSAIGQDLSRLTDGQLGYEPTGDG